VIFVTVRDDDPAYPIAVALECAKVGMHDVDAETAVVKGNAAIDDEDLAVLLEREAVHADLAKAAER
jgi:hypothetical protein